MKSEIKFTDSTMLYKFNKTYTISNINFNLNDFRGAKCVKTINIYINNKQNMDLAEMRNNWAIWKRVKQVEVEIGQRNTSVEFPLPVEATYLMVEFQTITLAKPIIKGDIV